MRIPPNRLNPLDRLALLIITALIFLSVILSLARPLK